MIKRCAFIASLFLTQQCAALEISHLSCREVSHMSPEQVVLVLAWMRIGNHGDDLDFVDEEFLRDRTSKVMNYCSHYPDGGWIDVSNEFSFD